MHLLLFANTRNLLITLIFFVFFSILPSVLLLAQSNINTPYIPSVIPPSPNASALMKFTDVPVSPYTGTADISVPIYTIRAKGITIPITLDYHTGGIKLKEEASWVGLGWALNTGGMISRTIMGSDDFGTQGPIYFTNQCPQLPGDISSSQPYQAAPPPSPYNFDFFCSYLVSTSTGTEDFTPAFQTNVNPYEMEPDIFYYNFSGHSGKFILTREGKVVMQKQENIKIVFHGSGNQVTFIVTDDHGNSFYFNVAELTAISPKPAQISSWLLTKIVTQQQDSIMFNYTGGGSTMSRMDETYQTYSAFCSDVSGLTNGTTPTPIYFNQTLQSIDFNNGHVQFAFDSTRSDLEGGNKLDSIIIYSKNAFGVQTYVKQDNFYYSYFNAVYHPNDVEYYRLKLDSVKEKYANLAQPAYSFVYNNPNPGLNTAKHSYNMDHWGYFNGASNATLIPSMEVDYNPNVNETGFEQYFNYSGANRDPEFQSMQTFSLNQVTYPTGGKTVLAYEPNDYDYSNSQTEQTQIFRYVKLITMDSLISSSSHGMISGTIDLRHIYPIIASGSPQTNVTVNVTFRYQTSTNTAYSNTGGKIYFTLNGTSWDIHAATPQPTYVCTLSTSLGLGSSIYNWTAYIDPSIDLTTTFAGIYIDIHYQQTQDQYDQQHNNYTSPASGLRIKSITNYKDANTFVSEKVYTYTYLEDKQHTGQQQQYTYGRLMSFPTYARYDITKTSQGGYCTALALFGSSLTSLTSATNGNIVGYDQVTETSVDPSSGQDIGKTVYKYFNSPDTATQYNGYSIPGSLNIGNNLNGLLLSKINYANNSGTYIKTDETDFFYHTTNRIVYYSPKYQSAGVSGDPSKCNGTRAENETSAWFYPSIKSERVLMDSTQSISYQQGDPNRAIISLIANYYDNPAHYQITRTRTIDSKNNVLITHIKYPQDYLIPGNSYTGNTVIDTMLARNMIAETIEKQDSLYYSSSPTGYITGADLNLYRMIATNSNTIEPDKTFTLNVQSPVTNFQPLSFSGNILSMDSRYRQVISFDQYDNYNNIQQYTTTDENSVTTIWDYSHTYPIVQVKNAVLADVAATSFEADGKGNWTFSGSPVSDPTAPTGAKCYLLTNGPISKSGLTSPKYIVSFWQKTGGTVSVTGGTNTVVAGKSVNGWNYYEYTVTGATTITISGTGTVDELRLYPSNAQMTTYTYNPLVGMTSECDADNRITYYFYDALGRMKWIKDQDGNIIKTVQYHYQGETN